MSYNSAFVSTNTVELITRIYVLMSGLEDGHAVAQLVDALRYKPEGRGFDSRWEHWDILLT